jgi:hypothetical protein|tara:strand:- start:322 stop:501 length:180 start_codon:yes stop_codon:yes gene_type:complete
MSTEGRIKYTYSHTTKEGVTLEVVGKEEKIEGDTTYIRRIDGYIIDVPTVNIITSEPIS